MRVTLRAPGRASRHVVLARRPTDPPLVGDVVQAQWIDFPTREDKFSWIRDRAIEDAHHPEVLRVAARFARLPRPEREAALLRFVQVAVAYVDDPEDDDGNRIQILDQAPVALERGMGKCTAKASLYMALCLATGIPCELAPVFRGRWAFPHVRNRVQGLDGEWRVADPCIVNSVIGWLPRHPQLHPHP